jgi:hypothetical protein
MTTEKSMEGEVRVRNVRAPQSSPNVLSSVLKGGNNVVRMALGVITLPLAILPPESRDQVRTTLQDTVKAVASFPADWANVITKAVEDWANQPVKK